MNWQGGARIARKLGRCHYLACSHVGHVLPVEGDPLKIAQIAPLAESVPPSLYGGTERVVAYLTDALVTLGHDVTLFASGEARTAARLVPMRERAIRLDPSPLKSDVGAHLAMLHEVRRRAHEFDILPVSYTHLRAHETPEHLVCRLLLEK